jgi:hypothetical protein
MSSVVSQHWMKPSSESELPHFWELLPDEDREELAAANFKHTRVARLV